MRVFRWSILALGVLVCACAEQRENPVLDGQDIRITFLHTADIHSRLLPYDMTVLASDRELGLLQENEPFGGIARIAHIIQRERARGDRVVYVDSGDCFQGAPIFNVFKGEIEQKTMSQLRPDAVVIGNHEFDEGLSNYVKQLRAWATYPVLAANYYFQPGNPLGDLARPYHIANVNGVRIAFLGIANFSSMSSLTDIGNSLNILPMANFGHYIDGVYYEGVLQEYIDFLRPNVDLIVGVSHAGLTEDEEIIQNTTGFDIIFGGHLHVALDPPKIVFDKTGRPVTLVHSGAFAKYVGRLDVVVHKTATLQGFEVVNRKYQLFPVDATVPEDATMLEVLQPYKLMLQQTIDLTSVYGYASKIIKRFGFDGTDSPLGNLVAEAIRFYARTDIGLTNTLGIRTDLNEGPVTLDALFNVFPFNNTVTTMYLSGTDVKALLDYSTLRSAGRGCATQIQIAGLEFTMNCSAAPRPDTEAGQKCAEAKATNAPPDPQLCCDCPRAENIFIVNCSKPDLANKDGCTREPLNLESIYDMATNDYIAGGGSGFTVLKSNNTQFNTNLPLRDAVLELIERSPSCVEECRQPDGRIDLEGCTTFHGCVDQLTAFHDRGCRDLDVTELKQEVSPYCGMDDQRCEKTQDCQDVQEICGGGGCKACQTKLDCTASDCQGGDCTCKEGFCVPNRMTCASGRCVIGCASDADCPNYERTGSVLHLCIDGGCVPHQAAACMDDAMCNPALRYCFGAGAPCAQDTDCDGHQQCVDRRCTPARTACAVDAECAGGEVCRFGWCRLDRPCDGGCQGACVDGQCQETCSGCSADGDCPSEQICARGLCVPRLAACRESRCRASCVGDSDCPNATRCVDGLCQPNMCTEPRGSVERCHIRNESLNSQRCLELSCPRAEADGRIKRILPTNLEDLPDPIGPEEPQE